MEMCIFGPLVYLLYVEEEENLNKSCACDYVINNWNSRIFAEGPTFSRDTQSHVLPLNLTSKAQV